MQKSSFCSFPCSIDHLDVSCAPLELVTRGKCLMPYCHFELEQSDYLTERRELDVDINISEAKILEFPPSGIGVTSTR